MTAPLVTDYPRCKCCKRIQTGELCWHCWETQCRCLPVRIK